MLTKRLLVAGALWFLLPTAIAAQGAMPAVRVEAAVAASSAYVWRGLTLGSRPVVQPSLAISGGGLTVTSWSNLWQPAEGRRFSEHDLTVSYEVTAGAVTLEGGWTNYYFRDPATGRHSNELFARAAWSGPVEPAVELYGDFQEGSGIYVAFAVGREFRASRRWTAAASGSLGYNHRYWTESSGLSDLTLTLRADCQMTTHLRIAPVVTGSRSLARDTGPSRWVWGIELGLR